jgi:hypothetical protein
MVPPTAVFEVGPIDGTRAHIERAYLTAWLDQAMRAWANRLLHGESADFLTVAVTGRSG